MSCNNCYFCKVALTGKKVWKCDLNPNKRFDIKKLHGWFCKWKRKGVS